MAIVLNCWEEANSGASAVSSLDVNKPTSGSSLGDSPKNAAVGDVLVILVGNDDNTSTAQWDDSSYKPTGFTLINEVGNATYDCHAAAFYKVVDGSEGSSFTIPARSADNMIAACILLSGVDTTDLPHKIGADSVDNTPAPLSISQVTTTVPNCLGIFWADYDGADDGGYTVGGTGWNKRTEIRCGTSQAYSSGVWGTKVITSAGGSVNATVTPALSDGMVGFQFALAPGSTNPLLVIQSATHSHVANNAGLTQHNIVAVQSASHAHVANSIALTQHNILAIADAVHAHAAESVVLTAHEPMIELIIQNAAHGHSANNIVLVQHSILAIDNASHSHGANSVDLVQHSVLAISDASHAHGADNSDLTQHSNLTVDDAAHAHSVDNIVLTYHPPGAVELIIADASHTHGADNVALVQHHVLSMADASHAHSADNVIVTAHPPGAVELTIADASHVHTADNVTLTAYPPAPVYLVIADAAHGHTADNVTITAHGSGSHVVLTIANAVHVHYSDSVILEAHTPIERRRYKKARSLAPIGIGALVKSVPSRIRPHIVEIKVRK